MLSTIRYILTGGGLTSRPNRPDYLDSHQVVDKYLLYRAHCTGVMPGCDGLLFTAIGQSAGACGDAQLSSFEGEPGQWFRSPDHDCHPLHSASDISKDMMMGLALWCNVYRAEKVAARTLRRALLRAGNMGRPWYLISRTLMSPNLMYYFFLCSKKSRRPGLFGRLLLATSHLIPQSGFQAHLQALSILLLMRIEGGINPISMKTLEKLAAASPRNALFAAMLSRHNECISVLMDTSMFPKDGPPSTRNYSTDYLWQRTPSENPKDWLPSDEDPAKIHSGIDFLVAAAIYLRMV
jgi:hypothetical protein